MTRQMAESEAAAAARGILWGIDLGGTKIEGIIIDSGSGEVICRHRIDTQGDGGYRHVLSRIGKLVGFLKRESGFTPEMIGFGTPGTLDPDTGKLRGSNSRHLNGEPLDRDLEQMLDVPVCVENDANCFTLAETRMGAIPAKAPWADSVFGVIVGTGVGGGIVIGNRLVSGKHGIGGEWGHNFLDNSGGKCFCGRVGCVETVISGPALERHYHSLSGERLPLRQISERSGQGDSFAQATIDRLVRFFGLAISQVINTLDPDVIVIGGGVGNIDQLYTRGFEEASRHAFTSDLSTLILKPELGDSAGVFGAAQLCARNT